MVYNERLAQHGITASTGSVGDSFDNALTENVNGSYKNELIHTRRWDDVVKSRNRDAQVGVMVERDKA
mgnify:CR=1 FL=1